jgi:hypothetical protein
MRKRWFSSAALAAMTAGALTVGITGSGLGPGVASASQTRPVTAAAGHPNATSGSMLPVSVPATLNGVAGTLSGTVPKFSHNPGHVLADLAFTRFTSNTGKVTRLRTALTRSLPVTNAVTKKVCKILNLTLGPLHLNLLGLVVNLNRVHLTITAVRGPGNLLGNLLCAVAHLLDGSAPVAKKAALLNDVVGTLSILGRL